MAKIVWVASYPKSGNTWLRFLLANLLAQRHLTRSDEVRLAVPDIHEGVLGAHLWGPQTTLIKTHWAFNTQFPLREDTIGIIHLVRHPITTLESNQNYAINRSGNLLRDARAEDVDKMASDFVDSFIRHGGPPKFQQFGIGSLEEHTASWSSPFIKIPRLRLRYEDLVDDAASELKRVCRFLKLNRTESEIESAISASTVDEMRRIEENEITERREGIFFQNRNVAAVESGLRFVGRSKDGTSRYRLTQSQEEAARKRFERLIGELGYAPRS